MNRRTKIIASIGPASANESTLRSMIDAGMDVARISLSHGTLDEGLVKYDLVRKLAAEVDRPIGTMVDLPGPKIRTGTFGDDGVVLADGAEIRLVVGSEKSTAEVIEVGYEHLVRDIEVGDTLAVGDGGLDFSILAKDSNQLVARVDHGGTVSGRKGIHIPSDRLTISGPTPDDLRMLDAFVECGVDAVALSFVRSAHDVRRAGTEPHPRGPLIVAKIETRAAVQNLTGIIDASGAVMIARGDLGNECAIEELPHLQKMIIRECIAHGRPAITATQMLESMVTAASPTRAEISDVANAVFDGSSVLMLSGETAIGHDPVGAVQTMANIAQRADEEFDYPSWGRTVARLRMTESNRTDTDVTDVLTMATWRAATEMGASAILCISRSGFTVRAIARFRPEAKILGFTAHERTVNQLAFSWGTSPILLGTNDSFEELVKEAVFKARALGEVRSGDAVAVLAGSVGGSETTDTLRIVRVP